MARRLVCMPVFPRVTVSAALNLRESCFREKARARWGNAAACTQAAPAVHAERRRNSRRFMRPPQRRHTRECYTPNGRRTAAAVIKNRRCSLKRVCLFKRRDGGIDIVALREPGFQRQIRANQGFDLVPNSRIALDLDVGLHENTVPPWILAAAQRLRFVVRTKIAEDASACGVGGANLGLAMEHTIELIKICSLGD